jgi:alkaline phosphatase D
LPELKKEINFIAQLYNPLDMLKISIYSIIVSISALIYAENDQYVLLVSMDGFRADYLEITDTPNFDKLANNGIRSEGLKPVFISKTFPNHYSIATGMYAENHGLIANSFFASDLDKHYSIRDRESVENGDFYGGEPIWVTAERQGVKTASYFWVGTEAAVAGVYPSISKRYDQKVPFDDRIDSVMTWFSLPISHRPRLIMLYFHEPDWTGHEYGPSSAETVDQIQRMDGIMGTIMEKAEKLSIADKLNVLVVSDHGMTELNQEHIIDLSAYTDFSDVTMDGAGPTVFLSSDSRERLTTVYNDLQQLHNAQVYWKRDIPKRWHYRDHERIPEVMIVAEEGWTLMPMGHGPKMPRGDHGYDNELTSMQAIFVADGPAFKSGYSRKVFENIHIYPLLAHILGLEPYAEIDGDLDVVKDLLVD